jgi:N-sulfoglucosamine sulfohydrolase
MAVSRFVRLFKVSFCCAVFSLVAKAVTAADPPRPNVLFAISDDQSWMHVGAYGDVATQTPAFDRVAREGVLFRYAFTACPSCAPSRSALLTGQEIYRLEEGGVLIGHLPNKFATFTLALEKTGYELASTGKTWGPGKLDRGGWKRSPTGRAFNDVKLADAPPGTSTRDYAANFESFLAERQRARPFFFWYGASEPHQRYDVGAWKKAGKKLEQARLPGCLPDDPVTRGEILDYCLEIEHFDRHLARMLAALERDGLLENTIVIVTSDHGNPLPRAKCNLYDAGIRVPLAVRWPRGIPGGRVAGGLVSLTDIAPTLLDMAGLPAPAEMTGRSLWPLLTAPAGSEVTPGREFVVTAIERHTICRRDGVGYPMRAIRTQRWSYIRNYEPARWPAGDPDFVGKAQGFYGDIDRGASKSFMVSHSDTDGVRKLFRLAFGRRPAEELYDLEADADQLVNLADVPEHAATKALLVQQLAAYLRETDDPRQRGETPWDTYPYYSTGIFANPAWRVEGRALR